MPDTLAAVVGNGQIADALPYDPPQVFAIGLAPVASAPFPNGNTLIVITATVACWFTVGGTAAKATAGSDYLAAGVKWKLKIPAGATLSIVADSTIGYVAIAPAVNSASPAAVSIAAPDLNVPLLDGSQLPAGWSFTRGTVGTYFDNTGTLQTAAVNVARYDYDPASLLPKGLLRESQVANQIRNNSMVGAVVGTPGTLPTNWSYLNLRGLTSSIVDTATVNGIFTIAIRFNGTPTSSGSVQIALDTSTQIAGSNGQTWTISEFLAIAAGNMSNISGVYPSYNENTAGGGFLTAHLPVPAFVAISTTLTRFNFSATNTNASTAVLWPFVNFGVTNGLPVDITLRIGMPQLELGAFASSVIATSGVAVTRQIESINFPGGGAVNPAQGTILCEFDYGPGDQSAVAQVPLILWDGTNNNRIALRADVAAFSSQVTVSTVNLAFLTMQPKPVFTGFGPHPVKIAHSYGPAGHLAAAMGVLATASVAVPSGLSAFTVGTYTGWLRRIAYWATPFTPAQLQALTIY